MNKNSLNLKILGLNSDPTFNSLFRSSEKNTILFESDKKPRLLINNNKCEKMSMFNFLQVTINVKIFLSLSDNLTRALLKGGNGTNVFATWCFWIKNKVSVWRCVMKMSGQMDVVVDVDQLKSSVWSTLTSRKTSGRSMSASTSWTAKSGLVWTTAT